MSMVAAAQAVSNTAELLEPILLELPPLDVLVYQRVSRNWRNGVQKSVVVQRALFLAPEDAKGLELEDDGVTLKNIRKPYAVYNSSAPMPLIGATRWTRAERKAIRSNRHNSPSITLPSSVVMNPMLKPLFDFLNGEWRRGHNISASWSRPEASWQNMFLTQPPTGASSRWSLRGIAQGKELAKVIISQEGPMTRDLSGTRIFEFEYTGRLVFPPGRAQLAKVEYLPEKNPDKLEPSKDEYVWDTEKLQWSRDGELL